MMKFSFSVVVFFSMISCNRPSISSLTDDSRSNEFSSNIATIDEQEGFEVSIEILDSIPFRGEIHIVNNCGSISKGMFHNNVVEIYTEPDGTEYTFNSDSYSGLYVGQYENGDTIHQQFHFNRNNLKHIINKLPDDGFYSLRQSLMLDESCSYSCRRDIYVSHPNLY